MIGSSVFLCDFKMVMLMFLVFLELGDNTYEVGLMAAVISHSLMMITITVIEWDDE